MTLGQFKKLEDAIWFASVDLRTMRTAVVFLLCAEVSLKRVEGVGTSQSIPQDEA